MQDFPFRRTLFAYLLFFARLVVLVTYVTYVVYVLVVTYNVTYVTLVMRLNDNILTVNRIYYKT
jgi:hypothetical protein